MKCFSLKSLLLHTTRRNADFARGPSRVSRCGTVIPLRVHLSCPLSLPPSVRMRNDALTRHSFSRRSSESKWAVGIYLLQQQLLRILPKNQKGVTEHLMVSLAFFSACKNSPFVIPGRTPKTEMLGF
ncbi:hypothetical protein TNCV_5093711 [Trichonephila clavipes]|nr:hypothetical protein TNCV_5093711 [Trichonephila clavipes]